MTARQPRPPPRLDGAGWLERPETQAVFAALAARGFAARAVGGAVRNALLGRPVADVDIATTAQAGGGDRRRRGGRPQGRADRPRARHRHGRRRRRAPTRSRPCARTWRRTAATPPSPSPTTGRRTPRRRDFTINALYCGADGTVFDPLGGYPDLAARRVRFIGDATAAHPRGLPAHPALLPPHRRLSPRGRPTPQGLAACVRERAGLAVLSAERVRQELLRLLAAPRGAGARRR